jgi:hypothetical protein
MAAKGPFEIPVGMRRVYRRFELWRNGHQARLPIPEPLWAAAAEAARGHGVFRAAKALHLEYGKLKRMVEASPAPVRPTVAPVTFLASDGNRRKSSAPARQQLILAKLGRLT